jgi:L-ascorbate metabolism protein UlaG (beta-lactamase superfamily)
MEKSMNRPWKRSARRVSGDLVALFLGCLVLFTPTGYSRTKPDQSKSEAIRRTLSEIVASAKAPGMIAAIISSQGVVAIGSAGVRKAGSAAAITSQDLVHLGSCTKAMTAAMIATLVAEGTLLWEMKVTEAIPGLKASLHPDYREVTLWQLLTHRAGVPTNPEDWGAHKELEIKARRPALLKENFARPPEVRVTYVGNAGFLIAVGDKKILIDALFSGFPGGYTLPEDIRDKMALGRPPFDGIDLVLATHSHGDHFESGLVRRFLANNPSAVFGSTPQAAASLDGFPGRVIAFQPGKNQPATEDIRGIHVEAVPLSHGATPAGRAEIINYGYLVSVNGVTLFQSGDIDAAFIGFEAFRSLRLPEKKIDLAFLQHFYLLDVPDERKLIREGIAARYIIPAHYHYTEPPLNREAVSKNYPDAVFFKMELQSWVMPQPRKDR